MKRPTISVIIPVHNAEAHIQETLESLRDQTFTDWEAICVENGSTDATPALLQKFAKLDTRFRIFSLPPVGAGAARNAGIEAARGTYICFCDADDIYLPEALQKLHTRLHETEADVVIGGVDFFYPDGHHKTAPHTFMARHPAQTAPFCPLKDYPDELFEIERPWCYSKLYRTAYLNKHNIRFSEHRRAEDVPFVYFALALAERLTFLQEPCYLYRQLPNSLSHCMTKEPHIFLEAFLCTWQRAIKENLPQESLRSLAHEILVNCLYQPSLMAYRDARACIKKIRDIYEPKFGLLSLLQGDEACLINYRKLKALIAPECTVMPDISKGWGYLEDCILSIQNYFPLPAEILISESEVPKKYLARLRTFAESHYQLRLVNNIREAQTSRLFSLDARRSIRPGISMQDISATVTQSSGRFSLHKMSKRIFRCCGFQRLPHVTRWQFMGKSLFSIHQTPQGLVSYYILGKRIR